MTYQTVPEPPDNPNKGGRPKAHAELAATLEASDEWVIVPPNPNVTHNSLLVTLRRTYFPNRKIRSRQKDGFLYLKLGGSK